MLIIDVLLVHLLPDPIFQAVSSIPRFIPSIPILFHFPGITGFQSSRSKVASSMAPFSAENLLPGLRHHIDADLEPERVVRIWLAGVPSPLPQLPGVPVAIRVLVIEHVLADPMESLEGRERVGNGRVIFRGALGRVLILGSDFVRARHGNAVFVRVLGALSQYLSRRRVRIREAESFRDLLFAVQHAQVIHYRGNVLNNTRLYLVHGPACFLQSPMHVAVRHVVGDKSIETSNFLIGSGIYQREVVVREKPGSPPRIGVHCVVELLHGEVVDCLIIGRIDRARDTLHSLFV